MKCANTCVSWIATLVQRVAVPCRAELHCMNASFGLWQIEKIGNAVNSLHVLHLSQSRNGEPDLTHT